MLYRLMTEGTGKYKSQAEELTAREFSGFTSYEATGHWNGLKEQALVIEIIDENDIWNQFKNLAKAIRIMNEQ